MKHTLPELGYKYDALEPHFDARTMEVHHGKHHQAYVDKLNAALEGHAELQKFSVDDLLKNFNKVPDAIKTAVKNHGGGHANHSFWWPMLGNSSQAKGRVVDAIHESFESLEKFKEQFNTAATTLFGSGWAWLVVDQGRLEIMQTQNQDSPLMQGKIPVLGIDLWEHAYYLKYQNKRPDYISAFWNVVNWKQVDGNFAEAVRE